ncbi:MAG: hypothetical protein QM697_06035 [Lachnospiraceae bacterium]
MALFIQCIILCIIFTLLILIPQFKNPLSQITSYPPAIRERVESLPQYKNSLSQTKKKSIVRKITGTLVAVIILALLAYYSGKTTFISAFIHVFLLFFAVNMYDLIVLDLLVFPNSKKVIIPGTEDMTVAYKNPKHHIIGAFKGILIGIAAALLAAGFVVLIR